MKMPEGLKIAYDCDTSTDEGKRRVHEALDLMKEMATMLEFDTRDSCYAKDLESCNVHSCKQRREILKKFKDWK